MGRRPVIELPRGCDGRPIDTLKVHRSFVRGCVDDREDGAVVAATAPRRRAGTR